MTRILFYTCLILLLSTALTSFGWYLSCNKPCDTEYITVKGDTVYINPEPVNGWDYRSLKTKNGVIARLLGHKGEHKVKEGQNLYRIGLAYNLTAEEIRLANNLKNYDIKAGQWLKIPEKTIKDTVYTYQKEFGDSAVKGTVWTQSYGKILSQSVEWKTSLIKPKNRIFGGVTVGEFRHVGLVGAYELKSGWLLTGQVGTGGYQVGVLKRLK